MPEPVFILGGYQTDFARNIRREGVEVDALVAESIQHAVAQTRIEAAQIDRIHVANAFGEFFTGQAHLGAMPATVVEALWGVPSSRHEAACASGSMAAIGAIAEIQAGLTECALLVGVEQERNVPGPRGAEYLGAAAWVGHEGQEADFLWPAMFDTVAREYQRRHGLRHEHLAAIAKKNYGNARRNPNAQTRDWTLSDRSFAEDDEHNPVVEGVIRRHDCSQMTDGAVALIVAGRRFAKRWAQQRGIPLDAVARVGGFGHRTAGLLLRRKFERSAEGPLIMPDVNLAIRQAFDRARIAGVSDLDGIETHDCFSPSEYMAIDHFEITAPGESWRAIEDGRLEFGGALPVNPSGGLMGGGHPVGASGLRMLLDATKQVTGSAGDYQVEGAKRFATLNIGGSAATIACFVVQAGLA